MTNEELQQKVKRLEEEIINLRFELLESKAEKKAYEVEVPEDIGDYYFIDEYGDIHSLEDFSINIAHSCYQRGLAFKTREEAEQYDKERVLLFKLHKWAEEHNEGWVLDWDDEEVKFNIYYKSSEGVLRTEGTVIINEFKRLPFFKSREIAKQFIEEFGEEIIEVLC